MSTHGERDAKWALRIALASYVYGFFSVFGLGLLGFDSHSAASYYLLMSGMPITFILNTLAILKAHSARKDVNAPRGARTMAGWSIGLAIVGFLGTVSYPIWIIGWGIGAAHS
jgi:hypothetical protein